MLCCLHGKAKNKKKNLRGGFPECLCCDTRGRGIFIKKNKFLPRVPELRHSAKSILKKKFKNLSRVLHSRKKIKKMKKRKRRRSSANGVKSSPSASTALGKAFPECTIFDTRERRLYRERISRRLFPECCTRGRLPRVPLGLPRVQPALGESSGSCSAGV